MKDEMQIVCVSFQLFCTSFQSNEVELMREGIIGFPGTMFPSRMYQDDISSGGSLSRKTLIDKVQIVHCIV